MVADSTMDPEGDIGKSVPASSFMNKLLYVLNLQSMHDKVLYIMDKLSQCYTKN